MVVTLVRKGFTRIDARPPPFLFSPGHGQRTVVTHEGNMHLMEDSLVGIEKFIADYTKLPLDQVSRIYRLGGGPDWPIGGDELNFGRQVRELGVDGITAMIALAPLIEMAPDENEAIMTHIERVANVSTEDFNTVRLVHNGVITYFHRMIADAQVFIRDLEERKQRRM